MEIVRLVADKFLFCANNECYNTDPMAAAPQQQVRITLKPWSSSDWPLLYHWCQAYWDMVSDDFQPHDQETFIELQRRQYSVPGSISLGVYRDGELGGLLLSTPMSPIIAQAHCFFRKGANKRDSFWGASTTIPALEKGFQFHWKSGYHKLMCLVFSENVRMKGLLTRLGGVYEGTLRNQTIRHGAYADIECWGIFRDPPSD